MMSPGRCAFAGFVLGLVCLSGNGCATVPTFRPQSLLDARAAVETARASRADRLAPKTYQTARQRLSQAEAALAGEQGMSRVEDLAFEAESEALIAAAQAKQRLAEEEFERVQAELTAQQALLANLQAQPAAGPKTPALGVPHDPGQAGAGKAEGDAQAAEARRQQERDRENELLRRAQGLEAARVTREGRGLVLVYPADLLFVAGTSKLQAGAPKYLGPLAELLKAFPQYPVRIEGYTDAQGDLLGNNLLSQARAESLLTYLNQNGISLDALSAVGNGPSRPVASNQDEAGRRLNRRMEIILEKTGRTF